MNDCIEELATQAGFSKDKYDLYWDEDANAEGVDLEKFAELIVQECIGLIRKQSIGEEILGGQHFKTVQLGETIATITEHFGVEE